MGLIKGRIVSHLQEKKPLDFRLGSLQLYVHVVRESALDESVVSHFLSELERIKKTSS